MSRAKKARKANKADCFTPQGAKIRSQHSIFGPVQRVAGPPGDAPRWQASVIRSWNRYELKDQRARIRASVAA